MFNYILIYFSFRFHPHLFSFVCHTKWADSDASFAFTVWWMCEAIEKIVRTKICKCAIRNWKKKKWREKKCKEIN